jgi:hypothetical protein
VRQIYVEKGERSYFDLNGVDLATTIRFSSVPLFSGRLQYKLDQNSSLIEKKKENQFA